jgi:hypothetical protein
MTNVPRSSAIGDQQLSYAASCSPSTPPQNAPEVPDVGNPVGQAGAAQTAGQAEQMPQQPTDQKTYIVALDVIVHYKPRLLVSAPANIPSDSLQEFVEEYLDEMSDEDFKDLQNDGHEYWPIRKCEIERMEQGWQVNFAVTMDTDGTMSREYDMTSAPAWLLLELQDLLLMGNPHWFPSLFELLRLRCEHNRPEDEPLIVKCATTLLQGGYRVEDVIKMLGSLATPPVELALFLLEHAPDRVLPLIRRILRYQPQYPLGKDWPIDEMHELYRWLATEVVDSRGRMAALLAVIDMPWSRSELHDALNDNAREYGHHHGTIPIALALGNSTDGRAREVSAAWKTRFDPEFIREVEQCFQIMCERHQHSVVRLRDRIPARP